MVGACPTSPALRVGSHSGGAGGGGGLCADAREHGRLLDEHRGRGALPAHLR